MGKASYEVDVRRARQILGKKAEGLCDQQVQARIDYLKQLAVIYVGEINRRFDLEPVITLDCSDKIVNSENGSLSGNRSFSGRAFFRSDPEALGAPIKIKEQACGQ